MRRSRWVVLAAILVSAELAVTGCTGIGSHKKATNPTTSSASTQQDADAVIKKVLAARDDGASVASAKGTIKAAGTSADAVAEVVSIRRESDETLLVWRLKSATGAAEDTSTFQMSYAPLFDTRYISLTDTASGDAYYPFTYEVQGQVTSGQAGCLCSDIPDKVDGTGTLLYAVLPPLAAGITSVDVSMPGFAVMKSVPVTTGTGE